VMIREIRIAENITLYLHRTSELPKVVKGKALLVCGMNIHITQLKKIMADDCIVVSLNSSLPVYAVAAKLITAYNHAKLIVTPQYLYVGSSNLSRTFFIESTAEIKIENGYFERDRILREIEILNSEKIRKKRK